MTPKSEPSPISEVTGLWIHDRHADRHWNILTVIEEVPAGQPLSPELASIDKNGIKHPVKRKALKGRRFTLYAARAHLTGPSAGERLFLGNSGQRFIPVAGEAIFLHAAGKETQDPPAGDVTVPPRDESPLDHGLQPLQRVLPSRRVTARARARLVLDADFDAWIGAGRLALAFSKIREWLGIDLDHARECLGATIWSRPNPWMRSMEFGPAHERSALKVEAYARPGTDFPQFSLTAWSDTPLGRRPLVQTLWNGGAIMCPLPASPDKLALQVHTPEGELVEDRRVSFLREINFIMQIASGTRKVQMQAPDGTRYFLESRLWHGQESRVGEPDVTGQTLRAHQRARQRKALVRRGEFAYFGAFENDSPINAKDFVRNLFRKARRRCIVADPYLSADEARTFALFVESLDAGIHLLAGEEYLRRKTSSGQTNGRVLYDQIAALRQKDPAFRPETHVLLGRNRCPLHDRFLVVDETVYHIGGSLNHLGERAMAVSRVPAPEPVMADLERWMAGENAEPLEKWLKRIES